MPEMAANAARMLFSILIQTSPTFWVTWILIVLEIFLNSKFSRFQVPRFPEIWPGARLGAWAWGRRGPRVGRLSDGLIFLGTKFVWIFTITSEF